MIYVTKIYQTAIERKREVMKRKHLILCIAAALLLSLIVVGNAYAADDQNYLCLTANMDDVSISILKCDEYSEGDDSTAPDVYLEYSVDKVTWKKIDIKVSDEDDFTTIELDNDEAVYFRADPDQNEGTNGAFAVNEQHYNKFDISGQVNISGNIMSLLYSADFQNKKTVPDYAFCKLFYSSYYDYYTPVGISNTQNLELPATNLGEYCYTCMFRANPITSFPTLPATELSKGCYSGMFSWCKGVGSVPEDLLGAEKLADYCYYKMFEECLNLTNSPNLNVKELAPYCYSGMFCGCCNLETAPKLPATKLAEACYADMFRACSKLTKAPELPATDIAEACYSGMFYDCSSITDAPIKLLATTLAKECYKNMFYNCQKLAKAPELPATELAEACYLGMFYECRGITEAPTLPATTLAKDCYQSMFFNCTKLSAAPELPATVIASGCYEMMFKGCDTLTKAPDKLSAMELAENCYKEMFCGCWKLENMPELPATDVATECYSGMFRECKSLTKAIDELSAMELAENCYEGMFYDCEKLENMPELPATVIAAECYKNMFYNCKALTKAIAKLPAKELEESCYSSMFFGCSSLANAPELPATSLDEKCYFHMFNGCNSLKNAPELPAETMYMSCYQGMFAYCDLESMPALPAMILAESCYANMFQQTSLKSISELPAKTLARNCYQYMFAGCESLQTLPAELPATELASSCYYGMFSGCTSLEVAPILPATELTSGCYYEMFSGCESLKQIVVFFSNWQETRPSDFQGFWMSPTDWWVDSVGDEVDFYCPANLNVSVYDESHVLSSSWTINPCYITSLKFVDTNGENVSGASMTVNPSYVLVKDVPVTVEVTNIVTPDGYTLKSLIVTDEKGQTIEVSSDNTFTMPTSNVTITAEFGSAIDFPWWVIPFIWGGTGSGSSSSSEPSTPVTPVIPNASYDKCTKTSDCPMYVYYDLDTTKWYHDGIHFCLDNGLMNGVGSYTFDPDGTTTRPMMVTILSRMDGCDTEGGASWDEVGKAWAKTYGISDGIPEEGNITREEFATMLYRYAQKEGKGFVGDWMFLLQFKDADKVSSWANEAVHWCVMKGILQGRTGLYEGMLDPQATLTRAEASAMIQRFCEVK